MPKGQLEIALTTTLLFSTLVGGVFAIENRYAKAQEVRSQMDVLYAKTLKLRILELQLKPPAEFTSSDKALLDHLQQELRETTDSVK